MHELNNQKLKRIRGGISTWGIIGIIASVIFGIGVVDGYVRPFKCR